MSNEKRRGVCLVISAPSGAGKSTIANALRAEDARLSHSVSVTTRAPRVGEKEGVHYFFRSESEFDALVAQNALIEWAHVFDRRYGTPRAQVADILASGRDVVFDIDWQGHLRLRQALPQEIVSVFVLPPSLEELARRLRSRASDDAVTINRRMQAAQDEIAHWTEFDYVVVNKELDRAIHDVRCILSAARLAVKRQKSAW